MILSLVAAALPLGQSSAQGIELEPDGVVFFGSASNTSHPATIQIKKVEKKTPEHRTIKAEGVRKESARYEILIAKMHKRIKKAAKAAAEENTCDCVVRRGDIKNARGSDVTDLTEEVIKQLESSDPGS